MEFHSLIAAALLCLACSSQAALTHQYELNGSAAGQQVPGPASLILLGAGLGLLGWIRRRGNWFDSLKQGLRVDVFPWPALCWLD